MKRIIRLADLADIKCEPARFPESLMKEARAALVKRNLRWDNSKGTMRTSEGLIERFSNPSDHIPHNCVEDVMRWEFSRYINNSASRISRGYKP